MSKRRSYFNIICAYATPNGEFGYKNGLPWPRIKEDMKYFSGITKDTGGNENKKNILIYGRNTLESIGNKGLPGRFNIVVSRTLEARDGIIIADSLDDALVKAAELVDSKQACETFLIGGKQLIYEGLKHPCFEFIYETLISKPPGATEELKFDADVFITASRLLNWDLVAGRKLIPVKKDEVIVTADKAYTLTFKVSKNYWEEHPENAYLTLCDRVLINGDYRKERTGTGTVCVWGGRLEFDMSKYGFPLFTTKRVYWHGIVCELLDLFLAGKTQTKVLEEKDVFIWQKNTSRKFLDDNGFPDYDEGETGASYGWQWRHFGAKYEANKKLKIGEEGFDQIAWVIDGIKAVKKNPSDSRGRRLLVSAWNPADIDKQVLPPCHFSFQFEVDGNFLNCCVNMRSADISLGVPFNCASYALLTYMIGYLTELTPGKLVINMGNTHVYLNTIDPLLQQLTRPARNWPRLEIVGEPRDIDSFSIDNLKLTNYHPHPTIKMEMSA